MSHHLQSIGPMLVLRGKLGGEKRKQLLIGSVLTIALTGCGFPVSRDIRAYDACITRHPTEVAVCDGPRQAYELDPSAFQASAAPIGTPAGAVATSLPAAHPALTPVRLHPGPITSGRSG